MTKPPLFYSVSPMRLLVGQLIVSLLSALFNPVFATEINVYSARKEALIKPLLDEFTKANGIKVNLITGKADALLTRLRSEGRNSPADLFITVDAGRLYRAKQAKVLQPVTAPELLENVPEAYRDPEGYWYGLSLRARVLVYAKDRVELPAQLTYQDLADERWKGKICVRSSDNIYNQSLVASMIAAIGRLATEQWARGLVSNMARPPKGGDRDQIRAVAVGLCDLAIVNTYYFGMMLNEQSGSRDREAAQKIALFWPDQAGQGVHVNISGAGVTAHAKNKDNAIKLLVFLLSPESQQWYGAANYEYPVRPDVKVSPTLAQWGAFKPDPLNLETLGKNNTEAVMLMDRAGWR